MALCGRFREVLLYVANQMTHTLGDWPQSSGGECDGILLLRLSYIHSAAVFPSCDADSWHIIELMAELVFEVVQESDGGYCAECLTESIFTEGDTWDELRKNVLEATSAFFLDQPRPERVRLHLVRDEVLQVA